jgi:hypothetical protein
MNIVRIQFRKLDKQDSDKYCDLPMLDDETLELMAREYENYSLR